MFKLQWYSLKELKNIELPLAKCAGIVKSIDAKANYFSFTINDANNYEIEATIYEDQKHYQCLELPKMNDYVVATGSVCQKEGTQKGTIVKMKVKLYKSKSICYQVISENDLKTIQNRIVENQREREIKIQTQVVTTKTRRSILNELRGNILPVQIRSLILGCVYMTLESNLDLKSYTFNYKTIQKHRLTKSYLQSKKLKEESVEYMQEFIEAGLKYLVERKQIQEKERIDGNMLYVIYRTLFTNFELRILGIIIQKQKTGTVLSDLVHMLNKEEGLVEQRNYIMNENLIQKILKKFIQESRIYKTSDKLLYPNS